MSMSPAGRPANDNAGTLPFPVVALPVPLFDSVAARASHDVLREFGRLAAGAATEPLDRLSPRDLLVRSCALALRDVEMWDRMRIGRREG